MAAVEEQRGIALRSFCICSLLAFVALDQERRIQEKDLLENLQEGVQFLRGVGFRLRLEANNMSEGLLFAETLGVIRRVEEGTIEFLDTPKQAIVFLFRYCSKSELEAYLLLARKINARCE